MTKIYKSPTIIVGFILFLALVIGTIYRITIAFDTNPGLVNIDAYKAGKNYGEKSENAAQLKSAGYVLNLDTHNFIEIGKEFDYRASVTKKGVVVDNASVKIYFYRQLEQEYDFEKELLFDGKSWNIATTLPRKGKWQLVVEANFDDNTMHLFKKIFVNDSL